MKQIEVHVTSDPENYLEQPMVNEVNSAQYAVGYESYILKEDEETHICMTNVNSSHEKANQQGDRIHWKSNSMFGDDGAETFGRLISQHIYLED